ncbi:MAG: hypothetical protein LBH29_04675 [Elusimicrobiota bacterium]|jgi:hypothetical protein|nr:hypothetical protein [Elusimicrobiota bacterium]
MANKITESAEINPQNTDWQNLISKTIKLGGGYNFAQFSAMDTDAAPQVLAGSRFEINGSFYQCVSNESITGTPAANVVNYVYAIPNGSSCSFQYSATAPTFQPQKGGWYNGNNRALLKFTMSGNNYTNKEMMRDFSVMYDRQKTEGRIDATNTRLGNISSNDGTENQTLGTFSASGTYPQTELQTVRAVTAGVRTLENLLTLLSNASHKHQQTILNCNCDCNCGCCADS